MEALEYVTKVRARKPWTVEAMARRRVRPDPPAGDRRLLIIAADHAARGVLAIRDRPQAMGDRAELLERLRTALARPGVDGVLGTLDVIEDLLLLGGDPVGDPEARYAKREKALRLPGVRGLVVGRSLLYPPGDDVGAAVDVAASLIPKERV